MRHILKKHPVKILRKELQTIKKQLKLDLDELKAITKIPKNKVIDLLIKHNYDTNKLPPIIKKAKPPPKQSPKQPQSPPNINPLVDSLLTLQDRYNNHNKVVKYIDLLNIKDGCISLTDKANVYKLTENLLLHKQIGSYSIYGVVFKTRNINFNYKDIPDLALKIQQIKKTTEKEKEIFKIVSDIGLKNKIINFPIFYKSLECSNEILQSVISKYPKVVRNYKKKFKKYEIILSELADGDINSIFKSDIMPLNEKLLINILHQLIISISSLHSIGYLHNDAHFGNFLYYKIKDGGYFHYKINSKDYYIENLGFFVTTTDYGMTTTLLNYKQSIMDYQRIIDVMDYYLNDLKKLNKYKNITNFYSSLLKKSNINELTYLNDIHHLFNKSKLEPIISSCILKFEK